jgi:outer membrane lipoprotein-sorting protein
MKIYNCLKKMFFLQLILIFCGYTETSLLEEIIVGIRYNNSLIKNWRAICKINVENEKKETIKEEELWAKKGDKIYREKRKENGEISYVVSFDGENLRIWGNNKKGLIKVPTDDDLKRAFYNISSPLFLYEFVRFQNEPLINFLSNKSENKEIKFRGEINLQNEKCYLIEVEVVKRKS